MDISDGMDKPWDHPWTTNEMRKKRREWSLAGDAGLLQHLQQFSENLVSRANKTEETLDSLSNDLNETAILIDNITNTSLALANTQFIESRVEEDDIQIEKKVETAVEGSMDQDSAAAALIANVSESVKQGLNIMYERYKEMVFEDSDSEEEDNKVVLSVVLGPNNPYQDRPLPYVIGSEKWKNSSKIGLGSSSSSESEQVDDEEESESKDDSPPAFKDFNRDAAPKVVGLLPSVNNTDYSKGNDIAYMGNDKLDVASENYINSNSESVTPNDNLPKVSLPNNVSPNFAEELAKRLGTVRQAQKPAVVDEKSEASINRFKDDIFTPEEDEKVVSEDSKSIFGESRGVQSDQPSQNLWKDKPAKVYKNNIIPASIDMPPPISIISTKPKSSIDDLFADADSEDTDDIFSAKSTVKKIGGKKHLSDINQSTKMDGASKKYLNVTTPAVTSNIATSTPETNTNASSLFSDDEDGDLFGSSKKQPSSKKKVENLTSDVENKLSNRISWAHSTGSSGNNTPANYETSSRNQPTYDHSRNTVLNDNISGGSSIVTARNNSENLAVGNESSYSSGISINPPSINNTGGSSLGVDFQPQMTSTRLKSEEIYRERVASDSLFTARTRNATSNSNSAGNRQAGESIEDISSIRQDDVFENDDLFGPPPLPKANSKPAKSKISSLFDDSDSGDELFSTTSSGSRSQKSSDFLTTGSQHTDKTKFMQRRGLFDEEIDIFGSKDAPDVDIFGITPKPAGGKQESCSNVSKVPDVADDDLFGSNAARATATKQAGNAEKGRGGSRNVDLFDEEDADDGDLFAATPAKSEIKTEPRAFKDDHEEDLFSSSRGRVDEKGKSDERSSRSTASSAVETVDEKQAIGKGVRKGSDILSGNGLFSSTIGSHGLIFEDDDYDDLFGTKSVGKERAKEEGVFVSGIVEEDAKMKESSAKDNGTTDDFVFAKPRQPDAFVERSVKVEEEEGKRAKLGNVEEQKGRVQNLENGTKKSPPKSLDIQRSSSPPSEENSQGGKRTVSGKIKNLMGKMGDLKILSPMDTPPLWRRSEEKTDEEDSVADRDSNDGGCVSTQGRRSPPSISAKPSCTDDNAEQKQTQRSMFTGGSNAEGAVSFDEPIQVETLSTTASKTRVRIQAKRRPQSRHARKSAIRQSEIDFDTVDTSENNSQDESQTERSSSTFNRETKSAANATSIGNAVASSADRLPVSNNENVHQTIDNNIFLAADDKSEIGSVSKESSMSVNKNTLLSPSTDEEDLFDVPPDLPEDPQRDDALFGRAPILSPIEKVISERPSVTFKPLKDTHIKQMDDVDANGAKVAQKMEKGDTLSESNSNPKATTLTTSGKEFDQESIESKDEPQNVIDPLRDSSHDPLKDPSQLFAFVTKTPSPEKGKSLLFAEDDSLFSRGGKKAAEKRTAKKPILDLFSDDAEGDLFSTSLTKPVKKPLKDTKISLFDEDDEDDSLFGPVVKKSATKNDHEKKQIVQQSVKKISLFDDDENDTNLFYESPELAQKSDSESIQERSSRSEMFTSVTEPVRTSHITDIFADQSSGEDDIFGGKTTAKKSSGTSKSLFLDDDDEDDGNIFGKRLTARSQVKLTEARTAIKKPVTRDLKKTAEKIGEDPLSVLLDE